ncbi:MAG: hypothetical protein ACRD1T_00800 [Acidimicrobiia bacterium]
MKGVPLGVRLLLAAGLRVPRRYLAWAIRQISSDGWPIRSGIAQGLFLLWPAAAVGFAIASLVNSGPSSEQNWTGILITFPLLSAMIGAWVGARWPDQLRERAIRIQQYRRDGLG